MISKSTLFPYTTLFRSLSMLALFLALFQVASEAAFRASAVAVFTGPLATGLVGLALLIGLVPEDRKSTRLNSSHVAISYAVFCLKKKYGEAYQRDGGAR